MGLRGLFVLTAFTLCPASLWGQAQFVYAHNDIGNPPPGLNSVSVFSMDKIGVLTEVSGSPFHTGGLGGGGGFIASNRIVTVGNFLYVSNSNSFNISGFSIDVESGSLTPVPGSPFPTGGIGGDAFSLAATPDGQFLYAAMALSADIHPFRIDPDNGRLTPIGDPIPAGELCMDNPRGVFVLRSDHL